MNTIKYTKINGAGNDFVLIDRIENPGLNLSTEEIKKICDRKNGIGADGIIVIDKDSEFDFKMKYYDSDGSTGNLCGNGARCAIKYFEISKQTDIKKVNFVSNGSSYSGELLENGLIKFNLRPPNQIKLNFKVKAYNQLIPAHFVDLGSRHIVVNIEDILSDPNKLKSNFNDIEKFPVLEIGREIRHLPEFGPIGVNTNFIAIDQKILRIRTFERGVEGETLACGTGAVASALIASAVFKKSSPIKLITKSNAELIVNFNIENNSFLNISLTGPVEIEHKGNFSF